MSDLERWPRPVDEEFSIDVEVEDSTKFFVYCLNCEKPLYCATEDNSITRRVAIETMAGHARSYHPIHRVIIVANREGIPEDLNQSEG
jgi:hypothetical protein